MESLLNEQELNVDLPQPGEIRTGMIASISPSQILVSIGAKSEGVITGRELDAITDEERAALQVGQEILVYVLSAEDASGNVVLSYNRAQEQKGWETVEKMLENSATFEGKVEGFNKGGLIVPVEITVYEDRSFTFELKTPPAARMLLKAAGVQKGSAEPHKTKVGQVTRKQVREIAEAKMRDLNAIDIEGAELQIAGTARSMGIEIVD